MTDPSYRCAIWPDFPAKRLPMGTYERVLYVDSDRTGGQYAIPHETLASLEDVDDSVRARLTTWLVDQRLHDNGCPHIADEIVKYASARRRLSVDERAERMLKCFEEESDVLDEKVCVSFDRLLAWTESTKVQEIATLGTYLEQCGWITERTWTRNIARNKITVTGHRRLADTVTSIDSSQAFVAMWFHEDMDTAYEEGIASAIRDAGYIPVRIDRKEYVSKIEDEVIAEIRRSKFVIADFTQGGEKARGSVYYEAGFAHGLGLSVIFTCHKDSLGKLDFDTSHYNHIVWDSAEDLREKLRNRIRRVFGEGPEIKRAGRSN